MEERIGQQLGNYRLVKLLGKGGFAEVYLGQHMLLASKQAAIKILHLQDVDARKFQEEAETTEKLVHPHIVRLLDFAIELGTPFLVLDYASGGSLRTRHPKGSVVPLVTVVAYLNQLAPALQYAHDQHILHRDIKPDNILIGRQGELLLSDFGIAVLTQTGRTSLSSAYGIGGTPYYMAPEAYRGRPEKASDQYALAVVVYEWLCGSVPFSEGDFIQLGYQHAHEPVPPLRERNPAIPPAIEGVIMKALAKEPKDRFTSVQTFAQAFEQACIPTLPAQQPQLDQSLQERRADQDSLRPAEEKEGAQISEAEQFRKDEKAERVEVSISNGRKPSRVSRAEDSSGNTSQTQTIPSLTNNAIQAEDESKRPSGFFRWRYLLGIVIFVLIALFIGQYGRAFLVSNHLDKVLVQTGSFSVTISTILYVLTLLLILAGFFLVLRLMKRSSG
jgi:serine/threonine protein kinase